jgi:tRNA A-37 threonylcarbamoyl transferase component Bud32
MEILRTIYSKSANRYNARLFYRDARGKCMQYTSYQIGLYTQINFGLKLGEGGFGSAYRLNDDNGNPNELVCKVIEVKPYPLMKMSKHDVLKATLNELNALEKMGALQGYAREGDTFYFIMKYVEGFHPCFYFEEQQQAGFSALRDCHRKNVTHFDCHTQNFIYKDGKAQAIDFGMSQDATLVNILADVYMFIVCALESRKPFRLFLNLFTKDCENYLRDNKLDILSAMLWWGTILYGAQYGLPSLMLPNQIFYEFLKAKALYQVFAELRSLALLRRDFVAKLFSVMNISFSSQIIEGAIFKYLFKPIYICALMIPYSQINQFYQSNAKFVMGLWRTLSNGFGLTRDHLKSLFMATPTCTVGQAALLYYPAKASISALNDLVGAIEPEIMTKARGDLYFQYHPSLYLKAASSKTKAYAYYAGEQMVDQVRQGCSSARNLFQLR